MKNNIMISGEGVESSQASWLSRDKLMKILLVEDDPLDARLIQQMLGKTAGNFTVDIAENFGLGLKYLKSEDVDVVLLDLGLPDSHDLESITKLRMQFPRLPIVIMTGSDDEAVGIQAVQLGAQDYLVKGQVEDRLLRRALFYAIERKRTEQLIQVERDKFISILNSMEDGVCITDKDFDLDYINPSMQSQYGNINKRKCYQYFNGRDDVCPWCNNAEFFSGKTTRREMQSNRTGRTYETTDAPLRNADGSISKLIIFHDITERKKIEQIKDEFVGMVSHELKTPLTVIIGALHTASMKGLSEEQIRELIQDAGSYADTLASIVENLLELSRSQADRLVLQTEQTDIGSIAQDVVKKLQSKSQIHHLYVDFPERLPAATADPIRVERILFNLVENAIKYSPRGGNVRVSARRESNELVVCVSDQGPGISRDDQKKLFQSFEQLGKQSKNVMQGVGLGLKVCRTLAEAHGGRVWVESKLDKGSSFHFTLPVTGANASK